MINKSRIAGIVLAGTLTLTGTGSVYAINGTEPQNTQNIDFKMKKQEMHKQFKEALDNLVKDGTLTRTQEDAILKAMAAKREKFEKERLENKDTDKAIPGKEIQKPEDGSDIKLKPHGRPHGHPAGFLQDLVKDGTLTQDQADAVRKAFRTVRENMMQKQ